MVVAAATAASVIILSQPAARARRQVPPPLPRQVINALTIKLVNPGPLARADSRPVPQKLYRSATGLAFTASGPASPADEWTADQMGGGAYILIYVPNRLCLTAPDSPGDPTATLARCDLSLRQRWRHQFLGKDEAGRNTWQLRSAADGRCLTATAPPLGGQPGESGVSLAACSSPAAWRQIISFRPAY